MTDEIQAGRETDRRVAEALGYIAEDDFGHIWIPTGDQWGGIELPHYSTRAGDALSLIKRMQREGKELTILADDGGRYTVSNTDCESIPLHGWAWEDDSIDVSADTLPLAICRFALQYLEPHNAD